MKLKSFSEFVNERYSDSNNLKVLIAKLKDEGKDDSAILRFFDLLNVDRNAVIDAIEYSQYNESSKSIKTDKN